MRPRFSHPWNFSSLLQKILRGQNNLLELVVMDPVTGIPDVNALAMPEVLGSSILTRSMPEP